MNIPQQVAERVKEAPAQALRVVFSMVGQVLLVADRIRSRAAESDRAQITAAPSAQPGEDAAAAPRDETRWRSLDVTGNVRLLPGEETPTAQPAAAQAIPPAEPGTPAAKIVPAAEPEAAAAETEPAAESGPAAAEPGPAAVEPGQALPVANYDEASMASLRARLRNLDSSQVSVLLEYEKANAGRPAVLTMFERRIAKLENEEA